jgi:hypothetical protein
LKSAKPALSAKDAALPPLREVENPFRAAT